MGSTFNRFFGGLGRSVAKRTSSLSELPLEKLRGLRASPFWAQWSRAITSVCLILLACVLGKAASDQAQVEAEENWYKTHWPSAKVTQWVLSFHGLQNMKDPARIARIQKDLPVSLEDEGVFWVTESGNWVYLVSQETQDSGFSAFCRNCQERPKDWVAMGSGWLGLEKADAWLKKRRNPPPPQGKKVRPKVSDPREFRF
ncbi:MAG: hypothetical protein HYX41_01725 [Bdellovibrio sp.]|nr:hypothetical protein [Bdellovibrio sp.]